MTALLAYMRVAALAYGFDVELLASMSYYESRHQPHVVSRVRGRAFCGVMQTRADSEPHCTALRLPQLSYLDGARILREWLRINRNDLRDALASYGCGYAARARCYGFADRVLMERLRLRQASRGS